MPFEGKSTMGFVKLILSVAFLAGIIYVGIDMYSGYAKLQDSGTASVEADGVVPDEGNAGEDTAGTGVEQDGDKGGYDGESDIYANETYGFSLEVPSSWKQFTVKEAIQCSTIQREYADCYFLIASPNATTVTTLTIDKASCPEETCSAFTEQEWKSYASNDRKPLLWEVRDIGGLKVYRAGFNIGGSYRENNLFMANHQLMEIYIIGKSINDPYIDEMRSTIDNSLTRI